MKKLKKITKQGTKVEQKTTTKKAVKPKDLLQQKLELLKQLDPTNPEIPELELQLLKSKRGRSSKAKGANYERVIATKFKEAYGIELKRTPQSGGFAKKSTKADEFRGDIITVDKDTKLNLHIECKDHATLKLTDWIKQSEEDCPEGKIPVVIFHRRQKAKDGKRVQEAGDYVCLSVEDFLKLVPRDSVFSINK